MLPNPVPTSLLWAEQARPGEEWGHKPILEEELDLASKDEFGLKTPDQDRTASYDSWSDIHHGSTGNHHNPAKRAGEVGTLGSPNGHG